LDENIQDFMDNNCHYWRHYANGTEFARDYCTGTYSIIQPSGEVDHYAHKDEFGYGSYDHYWYAPFTGPEVGDELFVRHDGLFEWQYWASEGHLQMRDYEYKCPGHEYTAFGGYKEIGYISGCGCQRSIEYVKEYDQYIFKECSGAEVYYYPGFMWGSVQLDENFYLY